LATIGKGAYGSVVLVKSTEHAHEEEIFALKILKQQKYATKSEKEDHIKNLS